MKSTRIRTQRYGHKMTSTSEQYGIQVFQIGHMPELPSCGVRALQDFGEWEPFCYTMLVARSPQRTVVVNAGYPQDISAMVKLFQDVHPRCNLQRDDHERVERQLERAGVDPGEVDYLVINPLGCYSTGRIDLFTNAAICISRTEWMDFHAPPEHIPPSHPYELVFPPDILRRLVVEDRHRIRLLENEDTVCPGIRVFWTGGHHRGSMAVAIDTSQGAVIYTDTIWSYSNLEKDAPIGWCRNTDEYYLAVERITKEASIILPWADPALFDRFPEGVVVEA